MAKKSEATSSSTKDDKGRALRDLFDLTVKTVEQSLKRPLWRLEEVDRKFGISGFLSTGLPSLDLALMHNNDRTEYGFPYGRFVEVCGDSGACKTTLMNLLAARNLAKGGMSYYITTEFDFDVNYLNRFMTEEGLEPVKNDGTSVYPFGIAPVTTVKELYLAMKGIIDPLKALADEMEKQGKVPLQELPPVLVVCDSLGALMGDENRTRLDDDWDKGDKTGGHAKELHDFFKFFLYDCARLGVLFVFTNHYRADLGMGFRKKQPAHDFATRYYCSLRLMVDRGWDKATLNKTVSRMGRNFEVGFPVDVSIYKIRGDYALDGTVRIGYYHNHGFDYMASLIDACRMSSVLVERKGVFDISISEKDDLELSKKFDGAKWSGIKEAKSVLSSDLELAVKFEKLAFKKGPEKLEDMR